MSITKAALATVIGFGVLGAGVAQASVISQVTIQSATSATQYGPTAGGSADIFSSLNPATSTNNLPLTITGSTSLAAGTNTLTYSGSYVGAAFVPSASQGYIIALLIDGQNTVAIGAYNAPGTPASGATIESFASSPVGGSPAVPFLSSANTNGSSGTTHVTPATTIDGVSITGFSVTITPTNSTSGTVTGSFTVSAVPEPGSLLVVGTGLLGLCFLRGRRNTATSSAAAA